MYGWKDCQAEQKKRNRNAIVRFFGCAPVALDSWIRRHDFDMNRSFGGPLRKLIGEGYSPIAAGLPAFLIFFVVFGPIPNLSSGLAWALFAMAIVGLVAAFQLARKVWCHLAVLQAAWIALVCLVVAAVSDERQSAGGPYFHVLLVTVPLLLLAALPAARWMSRSLAAGLAERWGGVFQARLKETELFVRPAFPDINGWDIFRSFLHAPLQRPLATLLFPAIVVVLRTDSRGLRWYFGAALAASLLLNSLAGVHRRLDAAWVILRRVVTVGGQGILSVLVIVLAGLRLAEVSYVTTVLDQIAWHTIIPIFLAAYAFFWLYEFWTNQFLTDDLLGLLGDASSGRIVYAFQPGANPSTGVPADNRYIQTHGGARLVAVREPPNKEMEPVFEFYERGDLFSRLGADNLGDAAAEVSSRIRVYFGITTAVILLLLGGLTWWNETQVKQPAEAVFADAPQSGVELRDLLAGKRRAVMVAASGGGTRAAMYTTAVMRGLYELGALDDLTLVSGVSGGGVSLAYFAGHQETLRSGDAAAWQAYGRVAGAEFISDVLAGVGEWRIARGVRTGKLLQESFERRFKNEFQTLDNLNLTGPGMIFNASLAGVLDLSGAEYGEPCSRDFTACALQYDRLTLRADAGGRLIFTNLRLPSDFSAPFGSASPELTMPFVIVNDSNVKLSEAAALHANFPPVFANAPVDNPSARKRYWVTDGGAVENRGLISLLVALRGALKEPLACAEPDRARDACPSWPELHVVVAEASASSTRFAQDRGFNTALDARVKIANQLINALVGEVQRLSSNRLTLHYLSMPEALCVDGGLGTHWMRPKRIVLGQPEILDPEKRDELPVAAANVFEVLYNLYRWPKDSENWHAPFEESGDAEPKAIKEVWQHVRKDRKYPGRWDALVQALRPSQAAEAALPPSRP